MIYNVPIKAGKDAGPSGLLYDWHTQLSLNYQIAQKTPKQKYKAKGCFLLLNDFCRVAIHSKRFYRMIRFVITFNLLFVVTFNLLFTFHFNSKLMLVRLLIDISHLPGYINTLFTAATLQIKLVDIG